VIQSTAASGSSGGLNSYLKVIVTYRTMILRISAAAFILSFIYCLAAKKIYSSTARILPPQQDQGVVAMMLGQMSGGMVNLASDLLQSGKPADLYAGVLKTEAIGDRIIDRFSLMQVYDRKTRLETYRVLAEKVKIEVGKKDGLVSITVEDKDPKRAADMANAYAEELGKLMMGLNVTGATQNRGFLENRLAEAKADLVKAEEALKAFQSRNKTISVTDQAKATIEGVAQMRAQLAAQEVQLATYRRQFTDYNQEVKTAKTAIANLKAQIARLEGKSSGASSIPNVGVIPELGQEYARLMREFKIQDILVELLTKQYEMTRLTEANNVSSVQVVQKARVPDRKIKPKRALIVLTCTMAGFACALFLAFVREAVATLPEETRVLLRSLIR
jgi:uncharacterized protein involved in exopolysaccharide biosynthesis